MMTLAQAAALSERFWILRSVHRFTVRIEGMGPPTVAWVKAMLRDLDERFPAMAAWRKKQIAELREEEAPLIARMRRGEDPFEGNTRR